MRTVAGALAALVLLGGCAATGPAVPPAPSDYNAIVGAADRSDADRQTDQRRKPQLLLAFAGVRPGMTVLDMGAGGGYSTELLARAVGPGGKVYGQDAPEGGERAKQAFQARLEKPEMKNTVQVLRPFDDPLPPGTGNLDLITFFFFYHDTTYMPVDRAKMDKAMFDALKPGGVLVIADHAAQPGAGTSVGKTLHRIEESALRKEVEAAGFRLVAEGNFLRNPEDPRTAIVFRPTQPNDEFVLKFEKPRQ
jgi:predicted methyltransferase